MVEYIKLTQRDLDLLIDVFQQVVDFKYRNLAPENWAMFEREYLPRAIDALGNNSFKIANSQKNILKWFSNQIDNSRVVQSGTNTRSWPPLSSRPEVQRCLVMLHRASQGQEVYDRQRGPVDLFCS